jgi:3-deoxy-D-manno-octulosonic-acid transferase
MFNAKVREWLKGLRGSIKKVEEFRRQNDGPLVWMHCASRGECEQGKPILDAFLAQNPGYKSLVTFFSPSAFNPACFVCLSTSLVTYLPIDTCFNAKRFIKAANPTVVFWIKYDYWRNHLASIKRAGVPCYLISANFRSSQHFFRPVFNFNRVLRNFTHLFVQTEDSKQLLATIGINNVTVAGDTRFDRVHKIASVHFSDATVEKFTGTSNRHTLIAGSSWPKDEALIADALKQVKGVKLILVPHEINAERIAQAENAFAFLNTVRYSAAAGKNLDAADVLIVDVMGILSSIYRYADTAYVGCGFDKGIHNTLEAAVYNIPVTFGPKYHKFGEARELVALGGASPVKTAADLVALLNRWFTDDAERRRTGKICGDYVAGQSSVSAKILETIRQLNAQA